MSKLPRLSGREIVAILLYEVHFQNTQSCHSEGVIDRRISETLRRTQSDERSV